MVPNFIKKRKSPNKMSEPQVFLFRRSLYSDLKEDSEPLDSACAEFLSVNLVFCNAVLNQFRSSELHEGNRPQMQ